MEGKDVGIEDVAGTLDEIGLQYMATNGLDGRPKVRPVQYMVVRDGRLWFCTNSEKSMYAEMRASPFVEICASRLEENEIDTKWIRFSAEAVFPDDGARTLGIKEAIMEKSAIVRELYSNDAGHPLFKVFYLKDVKGSMNNLGHVRGLEARSGFQNSVEFSL